MKIKKSVLVIVVLGIILMGPGIGQPDPQIGLVEGKLLPCPDSPNCVSSQSPIPSRVVLPLPFGGLSWPEARERLIKTLMSIEDCRKVTVKEDYIHAEFASAVFHFTADVEFLADHASQVIQVRSASRTGLWDFGTNRRRAEAIREAYMKPRARR
ncbi:MAG: DUF1499 domain-containing protein [Deltaproteobacteria bacterium]|nr:DUF1499 domain-containing protein [Deltaproteobacteria bacterium]